jgi:hypothetical protein
MNTERAIAELIVAQAKQCDQLAELAAVLESSKAERSNARAAILQAVDHAVHEMGVCPDCQTESVN